METLVGAVVEPPHADRRAARTRLAPVVWIVFAFGFIPVSLSSLVLVFRGSLFYQIETFDMACGEPLEIGFNQVGVCQGVDRKAQAVAVKADGADHFFVGLKVPVLIVLHEDLSGTAFNSGEMTGGARNTDAFRSGIGLLFLPKGEVRGGEIVCRVLVVVALNAGFCCSVSGVEIVGSMAGIAVESLVGGVRFHRQTSH